MNKPIYEIPLNTGINPGMAEAPPGSRVATSPSQFGPPPGTATPPQPTGIAGMAPPAFQDFATPASAYAPPPTLRAAASPVPFPAAAAHAVPVPFPAAAPTVAQHSSSSAPSVFSLPAPELYQAPPQATSVQDSFASLAAYPMPAVPSFPPQPAAFTPPVVEYQELPIDPEMSDADPDLVAALQEVVRVGASDLHVSADSPPMIRVTGSLRPAGSGRLWSVLKARDAIWSAMTAEQRATFEEKLELDFAVWLTSESRFRVNVYQQRDAIGAAFRLIPTEIKSLKQLGIPDRVAEFAGMARGLVLVTGPTGSGKSTTLAALIDVVNQTRADHIVTVEDPIEFIHTNKKALINQREVGSDTHSFANALKHVLRQDPDVILIGELRDLETISVALTAAETGHLVFATLHTQDAAQTIDRVIDVFPPHQQAQVRAQLAVTLQGVVCQTLVKNVHGGRQVAAEIMVMTPAISNLIREGKTFQIRSNLQAGRAAGMQTLDQHLADLVNAGDITHQAAYDKAQNAEELRQLIQRPENAAERRG